MQSVFHVDLQENQRLGSNWVKWRLGEKASGCVISPKVRQLSSQSGMVHKMLVCCMWS